MSELEKFQSTMRDLRERAERGDPEASRTLRRIARERRKRIEAVNGHAIPNGRNGENIFLNRLERRKRMGLS